MQVLGRWKVLAAVGVLALVLTACSSSSKTSSGTTTPTTSAAGSSATSATGGASTQSVSGTPYELMYTSTGLVNEAQYMAPIAAAINSRGGIAGHPLKIDYCDDNNDPNAATKCVEQAIANPHMLGLVGNNSTCSSQLIPLLEKAQMASIADSLECPETFKAPVAFPFLCVTWCYTDAAAIGVKYLHIPDVVAETGDSPAGREYPPLIQSVITPVGGKVTGELFLPLTSADLSPYAAQAVAKPGLFFAGNSTATDTRMVKALEQQGFNDPIILNPTTWYLGAITANFPKATNIYVAENFNLDSAGFKQFSADMAKYNPGSDYLAGTIFDVWLGATALAQAAKTIPTLTAKSVYNYFSTTTSISTEGATDNLNFTVPNKAMGGAIARLSDTKDALYHYVNGNLVQATPRVTLLAGASS